MKLAVLSDVHGNLPALQAVLDDIEAWRPDRIVLNGDLVSRGPSSVECLQLARERLPDASFIEGNHEAFVLWCSENPCGPEHPKYDIRRFALWTLQRLGGAISHIKGWPGHLDDTDIEGGTFHITHGSRLGNRDGIHPRVSDEDLAPKLGDPRDLFIASHTHVAMVRDYQGSLVVNTGSVGQPFDRDPRAAYGRFWFHNNRWKAQIVRVDYDRHRAQRDFIESGFVDQCGPLARLIHHEFCEARPHVGVWMRRFLDPVSAETISVEEAVTQYMRELK